MSYGASSEGSKELVKEGVVMFPSPKRAKEQGKFPELKMFSHAAQTFLKERHFEQKDRKFLNP